MAGTPLTDLISKISSEYPAAMNEPYADHPMGHYIRQTAPEIIKGLLPPIIRNYTVKGSTGQGNWMGRPWIAILNPDITEKASEGYFVAYAFPTDSTSMNLALCQGQNEATKQFESDEELTNRLLEQEFFDSLSEEEFLQQLSFKNAFENTAKFQQLSLCLPTFRKMYK